MSRRLTLNLGTRWEYDTGFFNGTARELPQRPSTAIEAGQGRGVPDTAFSPQIGFAGEIRRAAAKRHRGGFYLTYEMNIGNNAPSSIRSARRPASARSPLKHVFLHGPDGVGIDIGGSPAELLSFDRASSIREVIPIIERAHLALRQSLRQFPFDPNSPTQAFTVNRASASSNIFPGTYKIPYSMQFSIGVQRELRQTSYSRADYVRIRALRAYANDYGRRFAARHAGRHGGAGHRYSTSRQEYDLCAGQLACTRMLNCSRIPEYLYVPGKSFELPNPR